MVDSQNDYKLDLNFDLEIFSDGASTCVSHYNSSRFPGETILFTAEAKSVGLAREYINLSKIPIFNIFRYFHSLHIMSTFIYLKYRMITIKKLNFSARFQAISMLVVTMNQDSSHFWGQSWHLLAEFFAQC